MEIGSGELLLVLENEKIVGAGFFLFDKGRVTYLKGASSDESMKAGAMYFLMDGAIERYRADYRTFDFGGSEIAGVAQFFKKFGAKDRKYYHYTIDKLPTWFKTLKRIRK
jgi:lipid II:glycine glycyltransferase (peptidoglycan interpeptide bridge formation enzyme)